MIKVFLLIILNLIISNTYSQNWNVTIFNKSNSQIPSNNVCSLDIDSSNNIWIGSPEGVGIYNNNRWEKILVNNSIDNILNVWTVGNGVFVGTEYSGLWKYINGNWFSFDKNTIGNGIVGLAIGSNDTIFRLDKFGEFAKWSGKEWIQIIWFVDHEEFLFSDSKKNIWVGSGNVGLYRYSKGTLYHFTNSLLDTTAINYIPAYNLKCMVEDSENNIWVGSADNGLLKYNGKKWIVIPTPSNAEVFDMDIDKNNNLWLATNMGIMRYQHGEWLLFDSNNSSLPDNRVVSIKIENENKIWAAVGYNALKYEHGGKGVVCLTNESTIIKTKSLLNYKIYPIPSHNFIEIKYDNILINDIKISITNLNGEIIYLNNFKSESSKINIDLSNYPKGVYLIKMQSGNETLTNKILKL